MNAKFKTYNKIADVYYVKLKAEKQSLATLNLTPNKSVYGERLVEDGIREFRLWDPYRSKLAAAILKGLSIMPIKSGCSVLYLGAATGTTVSHVSDIIGVEGRLFAVELSSRSLRELINKISNRMNVFPILADARFPWRYRLLVEKVDVIYCDVAQLEQARILADNTDIFLKKRGKVLLAIKARSINSTKDPEKVFKAEVNILKYRQLNVKAMIRLKPYDKDHIMILAER